MGAQKQVPQFFAEGGRILVEKSSELDLESLDIGLQNRGVSNWRGKLEGTGGGGTHMAVAFKQVEDELDDDIVVVL